MRRLELGLLVFVIHFACHVLVRVLHVLGERAQRFIVASLARVRWLKRLVVVHESGCLWTGLASRDRFVLSNDFQVGVEQLRLLGLLGEGLLLLKFFASESSFSCQSLGPIIVILHVGDETAKGSVLADAALLRWIRPNIWWRYDDIAVFIVTVVLLHLLEVLHVLERCFNWMFNVLTRPEGFLVTDLDLAITVLFTHHCLRRVLEWIANRSVAGLGEEDGVACTFLHGAGANVWRVNDHVLHIRSGIDPR